MNCIICDEPAYFKYKQEYFCERHYDMHHFHSYKESNLDKKEEALCSVCRQWKDSSEFKMPLIQYVMFSLVCNSCLGKERPKLRGSKLGRRIPDHLFRKSEEIERLK